jgi:hypothetical protein
MKSREKRLLEMTDEEKELEFKKCNESPAYFYNNYQRKEGDPELSEEEFAQIKDEMIARFRARKLRGREHYMTMSYSELPDFLKRPLTDKEVFNKNK